MMDKHGV
jgi:diacylglycerol kinase family enzyme